MLEGSLNIITAGKAWRVELDLIIRRSNAFLPLMLASTAHVKLVLPTIPHTVMPPAVRYT